MTDQQSYKGLCIGGPMSGTHRESHLRVIQVPMYDEPDDLSATGASVNANVTYEVFTYVWVQHPNYRTQGVWVPHNALTLDSLFTLVTMYEGERKPDEVTR